MSIVMLLGLAALQAAPAPGAPGALERMLDCREVAGDDARLACFDRESTTLDAARRSREIVVLDGRAAEESERAVRRERRRTEPFEAAIATARRQADGRWSFRLEDGSRWVQADTQRLFRAPAAGQVIAIRPAALGSYVANVADQRAIRLRPLD